VPRLRRPRALPRGGTIGIAAPAGPVDAERVAAGEALLRAAGLRTLRRDDLLERRGYLAGDDERRACELQELVDDERVDAILCARGGYGAHRIVSRLDPKRFRTARKPLVGYSDATTLLLWQRRQAGLAGFHGPMLERGAGLSEGELDALLRALRGEDPLPLVWRGRPGQGGRGEGRLVGGSLTLVVASLGTPWEIDTRGAILLLEEVGEKPYRIDRMLQQLRAAGKLAAAAGIGVGALVECEDPTQEGPEPEQVIEECLRPLGVPWVGGLPFGHVSPNLPWPVGARAALHGERGELHILEAGVSGR
jgi:muramoyltetrapeptide carboxypeptidase